MHLRGGPSRQEEVVLLVPVGMPDLAGVQLLGNLGTMAALCGHQVQQIYCQHPLHALCPLLHIT